MEDPPAWRGCRTGEASAADRLATADPAPEGPLLPVGGRAGVPPVVGAASADSTTVQAPPGLGGAAALSGAVPAGRPRVVLVMPEFNEDRTIIDVLTEAAPYVDRIIVVDDGSRDDSHARTLEWMSSAALHVDLLRHDRNRGMSGALLSGFAHVYALLAQGMIAPDDVVVNIDADGQHDPADIPALVGRLVARGVDVVLGRRDLSGYPLYKRVGNWGLSLSGSLLAGHRYQDIECGFRALRVRSVPTLLRYFSGHRYGCAQELGVILPRCGFTVDNALTVRVRYYREGARFRDGAVNAAMGLLAFFRVVLRAGDRVERRVPELLGALTMSSRVAG